MKNSYSRPVGLMDGEAISVAAGLVGYSADETNTSDCARRVAYGTHNTSFPIKGAMVDRNIVLRHLQHI